MIFTTKNNEFAIFGKTLDNIRNKLINFNDVIMQGGDISNKSTKSQLIPVSKLFEELSKDDATQIVNTLNSIKEGTDKAFTSMNDYLTYLDSEKNKGYIKNYVKENQNQIYITDDVIEASKKARAEQIAYNEELKNSTFSAKAGQIALKGLSLAGNMLAMWAVSQVISLTIQGIDSLVNRTDKLKAKVTESRETFEKTKSELDELNSSLKTTQTRIDELSAKQNLTLVESEELAKLKEQNDELERELKIKEALAQKEGKEANDDAVAYFQSKTNKVKYSVDDTSGMMYVADGTNYSLIDDIENKLSLIPEMEKKKSELQKQIEELAAANPEYKSTAEFLDLQGNFNRLETELKSYREDIDNSISDFMEMDDSLISGYDEGLLSQLDSIYTQYDELINGTAQSHTNIIEDTFGKADFSFLKDQLVKLGQDGQLSIELLNIKFPKLIEYLREAGIETEELYQYLMALANPDALKYDELGKQLDKTMYQSLISSEPATPFSAPIQFGMLKQELQQQGLYDENALEIFATIKAKYTDGETDQWTPKDWIAAIQKGLNADEEALSVSATIDQLTDHLKPTMDALKSAWQNIFTADGFTLENVDLSMLDSIKNTIDSLNQTEGIQIDYASFEQLAKTLTNKDSSETAVKSDINAFVDSVLSGIGATDALDDSTARLTATLLENLGIANAQEIVMDKRNAQTEALALQEQFAAQKGHELANASSMEVTAFLNQAGASDVAKAHLFQLISAEQIFGSQDLNVEEKISRLKELATAYGQTAIAARISNLEKAEKEGHVSIDYKKELAALQNDIDNATSNVHIDFQPITTSSSSAAKSAAPQLDVLSDLTSELNTLKSGYDAVKDAAETYNEYGRISVDQAEQLIGTDLRLLAAMDSEENAYYSLANAKLEEMKIQMARNALNTLNSLQTEADAVEYLAMANVNLRNQTLSANEALLQQAVMQKQNMGGAMADAAGTIWQGYQNAVSMLGKVDLSFDVSAAKQASENQAKQAESAKETDLADEFNEQKKALDHMLAMDEMNKSEYYAKLMDLANKMFAGNDKYKENLWDVQEQYHDYLESIKKDFNWIETLLDSLAQKTDKLLNRAEKFFSWWNKNAYINKALKVNATRNDKEFEAYQYYMKKANAVGLNKEYRDKVANGTINIETTQNEELSDKIEKYQEWYEKAQSCKDAIEELYEQERELIRQKFNNILDYYDTIDKYYDSLAGKFDALSSLKTAKGTKTSVTDLFAEFENSLKIADNAEEKANAYRYEYNTSEDADYYRRQYDAIDDNLKATAQYKKLLNDIAVLEAKQTKQELNGKTLSKSDTDKLKQYYALREALEENATAETISQYAAIYNNWYKLQQKIDSGKKLTTGERKNYNIYSERLEAFANNKARQEALLQTQMEEAISKLDGEDQKAERQKLAESAAADLTAEYDKEVEAIQTKLQATAKYQTLLKNIRNLEEKKTNLESKGKTLSDADTKKLNDYYAKKQALDEAATASTINNYLAIYDEWKKLADTQAKIKSKDANADLSDKDLTKMKNYAAKLEAYKTEKATMLTDRKNRLAQDISDAFAKTDTDVTEQSIIDAYDKTADELRESYQKQIDDADGKVEETAAYRNLVAKIDNKRADIERLEAAGEETLTQKQKKNLEKYRKELAVLEDRKAALDEGATADNITEYLKVYNNWKTLEDKLTSGKSLTEKETKNYDKWKAQLNGWITAKQEAIEALNTEMQDALEQLELEKETQIAENEASVAQAQAKVYELAKQVAEFNISNMEQELTLLDSLVSAAKSYIDLYQTMSKEKLVIAGVIDKDDARSLTEIMEEQYNSAIESTSKKYKQLIAQQQEYNDLIEAAEKNDWEALFEKYSGDAETETIQKLKEVLEANEWDGNTWVAEWEEALSDINQKLIDCVNSNQELMDGLRENVRLKGITEAITELGYLQDTLSSIVGLINDDWLYDADGNLTSYGTTKVSLLVEQMENAKKETAKYAEEINVITAMEDTYASDKAYKESLEAAKQNYFSSLSELQGYQNSIVSILQKADESVTSSLQTVINKRKEALQKKKELYDYNKTIQNSQKEIASIQAQIDALQSLSNASDAAAKAKLAQLNADLADKKQALQEAKDDHTYNLQIDALDSFMNTLSSTMTMAAESVNKSFETYVQAINSAMEIYNQNKSYLSDWSNSIIETTMGLGSLSTGNSADLDLNLSDDSAASIGTNLPAIPATNNDMVSAMESTDASPNALLSIKDTLDDGVIRQIKRYRFRQIKTGLTEHLAMV